ncbi:kinase-like domain-containing protein, partial [Zopfochytrium polystomum]
IKRAVKRLFKRGLDARQLLLQRQEAQVMKALNGHANIATLLATVEDDECLYLIMEHCELGRHLYEAITQQGGFSEDVVKDVISQIIDAVIHCHSKGYYHRDLKPENCLITSNRRIKLTDFGLATADSWSTEMGCGSVRYMAPECFEAGHTSANPTVPAHLVVLPPPSTGYSPSANDVWALGVILLNLLFGKNPWFEAYPSDAIFAAFSGSNPNILRQQFGLSVHFDTVLRRTFDLDPRRRCSLTDLKVLIETLPSF